MPLTIPIPRTRHSTTLRTRCLIDMVPPEVPASVVLGSSRRDYPTGGARDGTAGRYRNRHRPQSSASRRIEAKTKDAKKNQSGTRMPNSRPGPFGVSAANSRAARQRSPTHLRAICISADHTKTATVVERFLLRAVVYGEPDRAITVAAQKHGSRAGKNQVEPAADFAQIGFTAARQFHRRRTLVADLAERFVDFQPVDLPLAQRDELGLAFGEFEILDAQLRDARPQCADPVLRISANYHVADIEIRAHERTVEGIHIGHEFERAEQELVPHLLHGDDDIQLLRQRKHAPDLLLLPLPRLAITGLGVHYRRYQQHRVRSPEVRVAQAGLHALDGRRHHFPVGGG